MTPAPQSALPDGIVTAVCSGKATVLTSGRRSTRTALVKRPLSGPVEIGPLGIASDEHVYADHGGPDMALLVCSRDHDEHWRSLGVAIAGPGSFGEILSVEGVVETDVHLGDVFAVGTCLVQVCQPRSPCSKLAVRFGRKDMAVLVQESGFTGYLLRVLEPGVVSAGDAVRLVHRDPHGVTVTEAGRILNVDRNDDDGARRVLAVATLGSSARRKLEARLGRSDPLGPDVDRLFAAE